MSFSFLNLSIIGVRKMPPFYAVETILIPFDYQTHKINYYCFMLNIILTLLFVSEIVKLVDEQFQMQDFLFTRTVKKKAILRSLLMVNRKIILLFLLKFMIDILFSQANKMINFDRFLWLSASTIMNVILWVLFAYLLRLKAVPVKMIIMILMVSNMILLLLSDKIRLISVFIISSSHFFTNPVLFLSAKIIIIFLISICIGMSVKNYEVIHGRSK